MCWGRRLARGVGESQKEERSKGAVKEKFHKRKTHRAATEETRRMAQPDRGEEGSLIGGQGLQEEELGDGMAEGATE